MQLDLSPHHDESRVLAFADFVMNAPLPPQARSRAQSVLAGVAGHFPDLPPNLVPTMSFRHDYEDRTPEQLLARIGEQLGHHRPIDVAILVHGLISDEQNFDIGQNGLMKRVWPVFGWWPMPVRYNTGLHISQNGEALADLLEALHETWGPRLGRVHVLAHSMGGLVARSALHQLERRGAAVLSRIDQMFLLAAPNQGAELERLGHLIEFSMELIEKLPETAYKIWRSSSASERRQATALAQLMFRMTDRVFARVAKAPASTIGPARALVSSRSDGIRDVRFAYMLREEWEMDTQFSDRFMLNHRRPVPPPPGVEVFAIAGSLWPVAGATPSTFRTDGLVTVASVANKGGDFDELELVEKGRFVEIPLLAHQLVPASRRVLAQLRAWNGRSRGRRTA